MQELLVTGIRVFAFFALRLLHEHWGLDLGVHKRPASVIRFFHIA